MTTSTLNRDAQLSTLANAAYLDAPPKQIGDWTWVEQQAFPASGFFGVAYQNSVTQQVVVSFRGTNGISDLSADRTFLTGGWSQQFTEAAAFTALIKNQLLSNVSTQSYQLLTTGHSLGGGIAQIIGQMFGLSGSTYEAPGALSVVNNSLYAMVKAQYAPGIGRQIAADFTNYRAGGSVISGTGSPIGAQQNMVNLNQAGAVGFASAVLMLSSIATGGLGGLVTIALGYAGVNIDSNHSMDGMERTMYIAAGLEKALGAGALKMGTVSLSQATGQTWAGTGTEPQVVVFKNAGNQVQAYIEKNGQSWTLSSADQKTSITLTPPTVAGQAPICIVKEANKPTYSCVVTEKDGTTIRSIDSNGDGKADEVQVTGKNADGSTTFDDKNFNVNGTLKDETKTITSGNGKSIATEVDKNGDGKWDNINVAVDTNNDGAMDRFIASGDTQNSMLIADKQLQSLYSAGQLGSGTWNLYTDWSTSQLVGGSAFVGPFQYTAPDLSPIGAFYESKSAGTDPALSIANKTFRILNSAGGAAQLSALDTNDSFDIAYDGKYFNLGLVQNLYADAGNDVMGASARDNNLWGSTGNNVLAGFIVASKNTKQPLAACEVDNHTLWKKQHEFKYAANAEYWAAAA